LTQSSILPKETRTFFQILRVWFKTSKFPWKKVSFFKIFNFDKKLNFT